MRSPLRVLIAVSLVAAACGGSGSGATNAAEDAESTSTTAADGPQAPELREGMGSSGLTGTEAELVTIRGANDGTLPLPDALDFFASVFGGIPGGDPGRFEPGAEDGTMALWSVMAHWEALSPEQQQTVRHLLGYTSVQSIRAPTAIALDDADVALQAQVDSARASIAALIGGDVPFPISAELVPGLTYTPPGATRPQPALGVTWGERAGEIPHEGRVDACRIRFNADLPITPTTVAHEVFHCFQFHLATGIEAVYRGQPWITEGSAEWAGAEVGGIDDGVNDNFGTWVETYHSVFFLAYPAVGFYYTIQDLGVSPWTAIPNMLGLRGLEAVSATGLDPSAVVLHMGPVASRSYTYEPIPVSGGWDFTVSVPGNGQRFRQTITPSEGIEGTSYGRGVFAKGPNLHATLVGGDRVQVTMASDVGTLEFFGQEPITWSGELSREFCLEDLTAGGCSCGADGSVASGLEQGARDLIVVPGDLQDRGMTYTVRIPPEVVFTNGQWTGTMTTSWLMITGDSAAGMRTALTTPFELVVEEGAVISGSFSTSFGAGFSNDNGSGDGVVTLGGVITGCGFSPQLVNESLSFEGTMTIAGQTQPVSFTCTNACGSFSVDVAGDGGTGSGGAEFDPLSTMWRPDPQTDPNLLTGTIDTLGYVGAIAAGGFSVSGFEITFEATKSG